MIKEFISNYAASILGTILTAIFGFLGAKIKKYLDEKENAQIIQHIVKTTVLAVEQMYRDIKGEEKFRIALENITEILNRKGIVVTELELQMLIESCVSEFNEPWKREKLNG